MQNLILHQTKDVLSVLDSYPVHVSDKLYALRQLILDTAEKLESVKTLEETLKWGEPSYIAKKGTTIRIDWKEKTPKQYAIYVQCTSKLIPAAKETFGDNLSYEGTRAIVFPIDKKLPKRIIEKFLTAALTYHEVKNQTLLGMS